MSSTQVRTGLEVFLEDPRRFADGRVGLLCHPASVDRGLRHAASLLHGHPDVDLRALFGPQHGLRGETQDNMIEWRGFVDPLTGLPARSLYGDHRKPTSEMLADVDVLAVDLQDVGARYYTFVWTLLLCLEACAEQGRTLVVLDRPNPLGGARGGNVLDMSWTSFVGLADVPMRHGLTAGEMARFFVRRFDLDVDVRVVPVEGWRRNMDFEATGLPWVMPSPNMPTVDTAWVYPGMCLLEGTTMSEGRGTTRPFEIFGLPDLDPAALVAELEGLGLPGVRFRPLHFEPTFQKHAGVLCGGAQIHVTDRAAYRSAETAVAILVAARRLAPDSFAWNPPPYEYEAERLPIDILAGGDAMRLMIEDGVAAAEVVSGWRDQHEAFGVATAELRLYD